MDKPVGYSIQARGSTDWMISLRNRRVGVVPHSEFRNIVLRSRNNLIHTLRCKWPCVFNWGPKKSGGVALFQINKLIVTLQPLWALVLDFIQSKSSVLAFIYIFMIFMSVGAWVRTVSWSAVNASLPNWYLYLTINLTLKWTRGWFLGTQHLFFAHFLLSLALF